MLSSASMVEPQGIVSLSQYIQEQSPEKPYRFVVIYNDPENMTDDSKAALQTAKSFLPT